MQRQSEQWTMPSEPSKKAEPAAAVAAPSPAVVSPPPPAASAQPPSYSHSSIYHDATIWFAFDQSGAYATTNDGKQSKEFTSNPSEHGTHEKPTALMQAIHWAKAIWKANESFGEAAKAARRKQLIADAAAKAGGK